MEHDHGPRGLPASDRSLQGFFGGVRRCSERATNFYAEQGGESPSGELRRMKERVAHLERRSASYESKWRSTREFANSEEAGRRMYLRMQAARGPGGELGRTSKRVSTRTANDPPDTAATYVKAEPATTPGPEADGTDSSRTTRGGATGDDQPGGGTEGAQGVGDLTGLKFTGAAAHRTGGRVHQVQGGSNVNSDGSISGLQPKPSHDELYSKQLHQGA